MNKKILVLIIALISTINVYSQCVDKGISTDPRNPQNTEKSSAKNNFFWFPNGSNNNDVISLNLSNTSKTSIANPFWQASTTNFFDFNALDAQSNFYPEDGWELIKSDFGRLADNTTVRNGLHNMPYFCLYNKYTGTMRFLGTLPFSYAGHQVIHWKITLLGQRRGTSGSTRNLDATNLLSIQGDAIAPLDKTTNEDVLEVITEFPNDPGSYFFWFDVPVAYDPCVCYNNTAIQLEGKLIKTATFSASGSLVGSIQTITKPANSDYSLLVAKRVIGAGVAIGTAAATDGAVIQTGPIIDLLDLVTESPTADAQTKENFAMLKKILSASNTLLRKEDKWVDWTTSDTLTDKQWATMMTSLNTYIAASLDISKTGGAAKTATSVVGKITMEGSVTEKIDVDPSPYWAVPGSAWASSCDEQVTNYNTTSAEQKPEYPLYNEPLGTFAFIKTPKMKINIVKEIIYSNAYYPSTFAPNRHFNYGLAGFEIQGFLDEDLVYTVNPKLNINTSKTKIKVMLVIDTKKKGHTDNWDFMLVNPTIPPNYYDIYLPYVPINVQKSIIKSEYNTVPVDINDFRELYFKSHILTDRDFSAIEGVNAAINENHFPRFFLRYFIEFESNNLGKDGLPIKNTQIFTVPVEFESFTENFPYEKYNLTKYLVIGESGGKIYTSDQSIYARKVVIKTNISTSGGAKVKIYAFEEIIVEPGVIISPDIELIILKNPFQQIHPQSLRNNSTYVKDFCENQITGLNYNAKNWATSVMSDKTKDKDSKKNKPVIASMVYPNPNTGTFNVSIYDETNSEVSLVLTDITGKQILTKQIPTGQNTTQIETHNLANGVYMLIIKTNDKQITRKVIINNP